MPSVISVQDLKKNFYSKSVISDLSFEVEQGEIFAFLGANGSGKTTTIRCLLDILKPTSGIAYVFGSPFSLSMSPRIGYLPEERGLYLNAHVLETLVYFAELKGISSSDARHKVMRYLDRVDLLSHKTTEIKKLSSGQQQKIQLGISLINNPELLILDEPTKGLDPVNRSLFISMLREMNEHGTTIIFVSHQMEEVEQIADSLVMIKNGKRALFGSVQKVKEQFGTDTIALTHWGDVPLNTNLYQQSSKGKHNTVLTPQPKVSPNEILMFLIQNNVSILEFSQGTPSLQEIFVKVMHDDSY